MLKKIKVTPLAAESFGVRSMCTLVETPNVTVLLDAGVSLAPYRFSLLPHPTEFAAIAKLRMRIAQAAEKAQVVTISHYHFDHHTPSYEDWLVNWTQNGETARQIYEGKAVLLKNPKEKINASQRQRAWMFQKTGGKYAEKLAVADGQTFSFKETTIRFSEAVPHGPENSMLGWVIMATIEYGGERFMHAPDVQGPMSNGTAEQIKAENPGVLMIGGPPFYLGGFRVEETQIRRGTENLRSIVEAVPVTIMEHHALRDAEWHKRAEPLYAAAENAGNSLMTAAEYTGQQNTFLESMRKQLYAENPPSNEFRQWTKLDSKEISRVKPPIN
ncbi:MAG: MBL fold metallo-hydrolase [Candidatus Bathyarchaeota archaeon]|nr:MBL fold metallo-hydrolase [Candidatus Bathyarchaeota archaeon]